MTVTLSRATADDVPATVPADGRAFDFHHVTPPGGAPIPAEGVTGVSVAAIHRRRGILRAMLDELHRGYAATGTPVALPDPVLLRRFDAACLPDRDPYAGTRF